MDQGYMGPYKGTRSHVDEFRNIPEERLTIHERFNKEHAHQRNCVETTFGVAKSRWQALQGMPRYPKEKQKKIIVALCGLHNYLWEQMHGQGTRRYKADPWIHQTAHLSMTDLREVITESLYGHLY
jgi:hypothetical protein